MGAHRRYDYIRYASHSYFSTPSVIRLVLIWPRTTVVWGFAQDAIRDFPILRPKSIAHTMDAAGHSFTLPADFRKVIYVEYPAIPRPTRLPHAQRPLGCTVLRGGRFL